MRLSSFIRLAAVIGVLALGAGACGGGEASRLGVQAGTTGETYANENVPEGVEVVSFDNPADLFVALEADDIQGVLQDIVVNQGRALEDDTVEVVETFPTDEQYGFALPNEGAEELLDAFNQGLANVMADGTYGDLYQEWFEQDPPEQFTAGETAEVTEGDFGLVDEGTLTVCTDAPYPPMEFEEDGEYTGFDIELVRAVAAELGLDVSVFNSGFDPITSGAVFEAGECDMAAASITITEEREESVNFSDPYFTADQSLLVKADSGISSLDDLGS